MNKTLTLILLTACTMSLAQPTTVKDAFVEKWTNSATYLLDIAKSMPADKYEYKPTERQMSFAEQLVHIQSNMQWLGSTYFGMTATEKASTDQEKEVIIAHLSKSFVAVGKAIEDFPEEELNEIVDFFAGPKSKLQMLNLLQDHLTHHRGQIIVYLNLNGVEPPRYSGW